MYVLVMRVFFFLFPSTISPDKRSEVVKGRGLVSGEKGARNRGRQIEMRTGITTFKSNRRDMPHC